MSHNFGGGFYTHVGKHANNKTMVKFTQGKNKDSKKDVISIKVERIST